MVLRALLLSVTTISGTLAAADLTPVVSQRCYILEAEPDNYHRFGAFVAIENDIVMIGRTHETSLDHAPVYLYDAALCEEQSRLLGEGTDADDRFGRRGAMAHGTVIASAERDHVGTVRSGSVRLFDVSSGDELATLVPETLDEDMMFGHSVGLSDNLAIVTAPFAREDSLVVPAVFVFDMKSGQQLHRFSVGSNSTHFGASIAIHGQIALVGAPRDSTRGEFAGAAHLYDLTTGLEIAKLLASDSQTLDAFGSTVVLAEVNGSLRAYIGAPGDRDHGFATGAVYVFDALTGAERSKFVPATADLGDEFGSEIAIDGRYAVVSAPRTHIGPLLHGQAYFVDLITEAISLPFQPESEILHHAEFGSAVGLDVRGNHAIAVIGAAGDPTNGLISGAAYLFDFDLTGLCRSDIDASGETGLGDLLQILSTWGPCGGCAPDLDDDGTVGLSDLLQVLALWGPCSSK